MLIISTIFTDNLLLSDNGLFFTTSFIPFLIRYFTVCLCNYQKFRKITNIFHCSLFVFTIMKRTGEGKFGRMVNMGHEEANEGDKMMPLKGCKSKNGFIFVA